MTGDVDSDGGTDPDADGTETYAVEFVEEGRTIDCGADEYILDAANEAGIDVQFGCLMGVCTICSARVEGATDQSEGAALTPQEIEDEGYVLTCVAYPRSDLRVWTSEGP